MSRRLSHISWSVLATALCVSVPLCSYAQDLFVGHYTDPGDIGQYSNSGTLIRSLTTGGDFQPGGMTFGPAGLLYACDSFHNYIDIFNPTTGLSVGTVGHLGAIQLASGPDGFLYAHEGTTVYKINTATNTQQPLFSLDFIPGGMAFRPDNGDLLVANTGSAGSGTDIREFSLTTNQEVGVFATGYKAPFGMTFGPDGRLYTAEYENANSAIRVVGATGGASTVFATGGSYLSYVAFDNSGTLLATSNGTGQVLKFDGTTGALLTSFNTGAGSFGLAVKTSVPAPGALLTALMGALPGTTLLLARRRKKQGSKCNGTSSAGLVGANMTVAVP